MSKPRFKDPSSKSYGDYLRGAGYSEPEIKGIKSGRRFDITKTDAEKLAELEPHPDGRKAFVGWGNFIRGPKKYKGGDNFL